MKHVSLLRFVQPHRWNQELPLVPWECHVLSQRCNVRLPKDFKGPRKVPNYTADLSPETWVKSYEMAMEMLDVDDAACAKYFTMMLEGTARTWLKSLPANSIRSWAELRARFIQNFEDTCKKPMSIVDLAACVQEEGESTTHWGFGDFAFIRPHQR